MANVNQGPDFTMNKGKQILLNDEDEIQELLEDNFKCCICFLLLKKPVSTRCGHSFCLRCFKMWIAQGMNSCAKCSRIIPKKIATQPCINSELEAAIQMAKSSKLVAPSGVQNASQIVLDQYQPDKAYNTDRAKKTGYTNGASGKIFVTTPNDHFGPILAENDPERNQGVLVGESWKYRSECRQWGVHYPPISGIAGQQRRGAQSVVLSGGYEDDEDHGDWFLYTGSGGRDLSGNRRTNKLQSFDQTFESSNAALRVSCEKGYPVRVLRSSKDKGSPFAPVEGYRYDGIYRIEKSWRKEGSQGFKVCRFLFVRCDNAPAPWYTNEQRDKPRPLPVIEESEHAIDVFERTESPSWAFDEEETCWKWKKPPPSSEHNSSMRNSLGRKRKRDSDNTENPQLNTEVVEIMEELNDANENEIDEDKDNMNEEEEEEVFHVEEHIVNPNNVNEHQDVEESIFQDILDGEPLIDLSKI